VFRKSKLDLTSLRLVPITLKTTQYKSTIDPRLKIQFTDPNP
jgi:hypothetical protein